MIRIEWQEIERFEQEMVQWHRKMAVWLLLTVLLGFVLPVAGFCYLLAEVWK